MYYGGFALAAITAAVVICGAAHTRGAVTRVLRIRPLVATGRISYGLYLWHWPVFVALAQTRLTGAALLIARFGATFACATLSYVFVEQPIRRWRPRPRPARRGFATAFAAGAVAVAIAISLVVVTTGGGVDPHGPAAAAAPIARVTRLDPPRVVMAGDSTMFTLSYYGDFGTVAKADVQGWAPLGCGLVSAERVAGAKTKQECRTWPAVWRGFVRAFDPDVFVLEVGRWDVSDHVINGTTFTPGTPAFATAFTGALEQARQIAATRGGTLVLLDLPCLPDVPDARRAALNSILDAFASAHAHDVSIIRWSDYLCPNGQNARQGGRPLRPDGIHFDKFSAPTVAAWLAPQIREQALAVRDARARG
jgi:hypothetical protein